MTANNQDPVAMPRMGPRPLALHLATAAMTWSSSLIALPRLKNGLPPWKPPFVERAAELSGALAADVAFAKDTLAIELERRGLRFEPFSNLREVISHLESLLRSARSDTRSASI